MARFRCDIEAEKEKHAAAMAAAVKSAVARAVEEADSRLRAATVSTAERHAAEMDNVIYFLILNEFLLFSLYLRVLLFISLTVCECFSLFDRFSRFMLASVQPLPVAMK